MYQEADLDVCLYERGGIARRFIAVCNPVLDDHGRAASCKITLRHKEVAQLPPPSQLPSQEIATTRPTPPPSTAVDPPRGPRMPQNAHGVRALAFSCSSSSQHIHDGLSHVTSPPRTVMAVLPAADVSTDGAAEKLARRREHNFRTGESLCAEMARPPHAPTPPALPAAAEGEEGGKEDVLEWLLAEAER
jgi:hypothetical protein